MTDFAKAWQLSRHRFAESVSDLNQVQLNYRLHPDVLTAGEMVLHVVGVEIWFVAQLTGQELNEVEVRLTKAAVDGVVNDNPFPYRTDEISPQMITWAFQRGQEIVKEHIENPSAEFLAKEIKSALGPIITGEGALARFAFHPAYHQGQVHLIRTSPGFPA
jgi:Protein of unknown function (DUF664)